MMTTTPTSPPTYRTIYLHPKFFAFLLEMLLITNLTADLESDIYARSALLTPRLGI
jgi:hypothetical protein